MTQYSYVCTVCGCPDTQDAPDYNDVCPKCASPMECIGVDQAATDRGWAAWEKAQCHKDFLRYKALGLSDEAAGALSSHLESDTATVSGKDREILAQKVDDPAKCAWCGAELGDVVCYHAGAGFCCNEKCADDWVWDWADSYDPTPVY
jgi:hypothetical protein